ncbi:tetratricopeptide repeat protein, partial [Aetokthonos hydrillicola]|uniref:tetratricopeptide repeat protein n=1 Tax=Aetokthonos hydrillicola TaxID=1550245 RepID=UPI001FB93727
HYSLGTTYHELGIVAQELREYDEAWRNYQQALQIFVEYDDRYPRGTSIARMRSRSSLSLQPRLEW